MPIVGSRFSDRAHYNEFVESESKSWALIRRRLVLGVKNIQNQAAQRLREKGPLARGRESPTPLGQTGASFLSLGLPLLLVPNIAVRLNGVTIKLVQGSRYVFNLPTLYSCVIQWFEDIALMGICWVCFAGYLLFQSEC